MKKLLIFLICIATQFAKAEYRVFSLLISNPAQQKFRQIETTLDPEQFITLYPLNQGEVISYIDTWRCNGRTDGFRSHCAHPNTNQKPATNPSQETPSDQGPEVLQPKA